MAVEGGFTFGSVWDTVAYMSVVRSGSRTRTRQPSRLWKGSVIVLMVLGSLAMWIANPILWMWIIAPLQPSPPSMAIYVLLLAGFILSIMDGRLRVHRSNGITPPVEQRIPRSADR